MWKYTVRRLLVAIPILVIISALDFFVINLAPGDPLQSLLPPETGINAGELHDLYARSGLADSIPVRYVRWLGQLARGNLGTSFQTSQPVTRMLRETLPPTLLLTATAQALALLLGIPLGVVGALRERSLLDHALTLLSFVLTALPSFFLAIVAVFVFAVRLDWFPTTGMQSFDKPGDLGDLLHHLILPALILGLLAVPGYARYTRAAILDVLSADYIRTARAKGLREGGIVRRHLLPNALLPLVTVIGLHLPGLVGSSVLVEQVFAWPGMGQLSIKSALFRDYPVFMATALVYAVAVLVSSLCTDLIYAIVDPRIRYA